MEGWRLARGLPGAIEVDGSLRVDIGRVDRDVEYVVVDADQHPRRIDRAASAALSARAPWVTVPTRDPGRTADRLSEHGLRSLVGPQWLMAIELDDQRRGLIPDGYDAHVSTSAGVVRLELRDSADTLAASSQLGVTTNHAVPDKILTREEHRRRGLGAAMMTALCDAASDLGASRGLLIASDPGRALYTALGWSTLSPILTARLWD